MKELVEITGKLENQGLDVEYLSKWETYRIRIKPGEFTKHQSILAELMKEASIQKGG